MGGVGAITGARVYVSMVTLAMAVTIVARRVEPQPRKTIWLL